MKVAVVGLGSWGTALALLLARNGHQVKLLGRTESEVRTLIQTRENARYLPGFLLPDSVQFSLLDCSPIESEMTVIAVPSGAVNEIVSKIDGPHPIVVVAAKGLEPETARLMTEVVASALPKAAVGVLSGPNLAVEIARGIPTVAVSAHADRYSAYFVREAFNSPFFRVSVTSDVTGVEIAGALKNVLAIGAGISDGLGYGDNTKGAFLSRGLLEMAKLGSAMGAVSETFLGPAGVGDLFATAASRLSRNYRLGYALGMGQSLEEAVATVGQVAEGVPTSAAVHILARRHQTDMPVFAAVGGILMGHLPPNKAVSMLMDRSVSMDDFLK
jgi:glycerol-3-phosphate dehydrogenase (NAD(P)+)